MINCPNKKCNRELEYVRVYSECYQKGWLSSNENEPNRIDNYDSVEELTETIAIECPYCGQDVRELVEE